MIKKQVEEPLIERCQNDLCCMSWVFTFFSTDQFSYFFSSPEHEVLMVSYWDSAVSVVRRPSSTFYLVYALEATVLVGYS